MYLKFKMGSIGCTNSKGPCYYHAYNFYESIMFSILFLWNLCVLFPEIMNN